MGTEPLELNATQGALLGFLHDGPMTGWDLVREVKGGLDRFWNITTSHVYRELRALEQQRLLEAGPAGPRDRRPFTITAAGREAFKGWINQQPGPEQIRFPLLVTLWFGRHLTPGTLARFIAANRDDHAERLALYEELATAGATPDASVEAVVRFGLAYERAVIGWLDEIGPADSS